MSPSPDGARQRAVCHFGAPQKPQSCIWWRRWTLLSTAASPKITPTRDSTREQSSVEMSHLRVSPPPLICRFPFLPPTFVPSFPHHRLRCSHHSWHHLHVSGSATSSLVHVGYGTAPGDGRRALAVVEQPDLHPCACSSMGFPRCPAQLQEQHKLLRLREK